MSIVKRNKNDRVMVFIDLQNIEKKMYDFFYSGIVGAKVDYEELIAKLVGDRNLIAA